MNNDGSSKYEYKKTTNYIKLDDRSTIPPYKAKEQKPVFVMDEGWQEELDMVAREGEEDGMTASLELEESTVNFIKELDL